MKLFVLCLLVFIIFLAPLNAQHGHWTDNYQSAGGGRCCGIVDCRPVFVQLIEQQGTQTTVGVDAVILQLPSASVHLSEDTNGWICLRNTAMPLIPSNIRCVFLSFGM